MAIRRQSEIDEEARQTAFETAVAETVEEPEVEEEAQALAPSTQDDVTDDEIVFVDEREVPEETEEAGKVDTTSNLLEKLTDAITSRPVAPTPEPAAPPARAALPTVNKEEVRKKFNEKLHETDDPFALVEESAQALVGGALAAQSQEIQELRKATLKVDPINSIIFEKWENEVETVISNLPAAQQVNPKAYDYALKEVRDRHFNEILDMKVDEKVAAKQRPGPTATINSTRGESTATKRKVRKVAVSQRDRNEAKRYGMTLNGYLQARGKI